MTDNKPLVTHIFTADPSAHVFNGKLYVYPSHDVKTDIQDNDNGGQYAMTDYHVLSMERCRFTCYGSRGSLGTGRHPVDRKAALGSRCGYEERQILFVLPSER